MLVILKDPECCRLLREHKGPGYIRTQSSGVCASTKPVEVAQLSEPVKPSETLMLTDAEREEREDRIFRERVARFVTG